MPKPKVSVVVPARNEEKYIEKCLKALKKQTRPCEIIVVDGHSTDKTRAIAKKYADVVVLDNRKGIADARNMGAKAAKGEIVAYCDADSIPHKNWVENIEKHMGGNILIYGPIVPYDGSRKTKVTFKFLNALINFFHKTKYSYVVCGANMAAKRSDILKHKFSEKMAILEDYEIAYRLGKHGKIGYYKELSMPISSRRYEGRLFYVIYFFYIKNMAKAKRGERIEAEKYWQEMEDLKRG